MVTLEQLKTQVRLRGILPNQLVTVINVEWNGSNAVTLVYRRSDGKLDETLLYREDEARMELVQASDAWAFDGDAQSFKRVSEAYRIHLAHLFDPLLAVHSSLIEPLPHQITAVYQEMLHRQPLRYLLADDPGAGKTIMAGLLIRELIMRGDVRRCLICAPGSLSEQWQDELWSKFQLDFSLMSRTMLEDSRTGNPFAEHDLMIVRLDQISRSADLQERLQQSDWDLIVCDEAHKMSASFFGGDLKETKRYKLGKLLGVITRHFLLMTATPHNGKEEDFQLFLALLDADRFEGRFRDGVHRVDVSDLMRRMVKESLLKFDGKPLFPERRAYTVNYSLSPEELSLYDQVTDYVRQQFNNAERLEDEGRRGTVGFALTVLQRRLASSPEAIYQSLKRRRERLEKRLKDLQRQQSLATPNFANFEDADWDELDDELESADEQTNETLALLDSATAARTLSELDQEIASLRQLESQALKVRRSGQDRKWSELQRVIDEIKSSLHAEQEGQALSAGKYKLVIFTEHRDTLNYLQDRLQTNIGQNEAIVCIHGGLRREDRRAVEERFRNDPDVMILLATDAAGEGINLQRAHLMLNYDLPWNPNRLEQRFGRIHRIGQSEVCHLWNLVAGETREGSVYQRLLKKLEAERHALDGQVFDVLGKLFQETPLRKLLVDAVRYGDDPEVRARLEQAVDNAVDRERVRDLLEHEALVTSSLDTREIMHIRADMERAEARRLQPYYIKAFFMQAFEALGGTLHERETGRYSIHHVPAVLRNYAKERGLGAISLKYERICFEKRLIQANEGERQRPAPVATFVCPGHPLLDALISLTLERERALLRRGTVLIDTRETAPDALPRLLFYLEQSLYDALPSKSAERRVISQAVHFVEIDRAGVVREAGGAPYLDYREPSPEELTAIRAHLTGWENGAEQSVLEYAVSTLIPRHLNEVKTRRWALIDKTEAAVQERLTKEINYWDLRSAELRAQEQAGKHNARLNSQRAQERADRLAERLQQRKEQLAQERQISPAPPIVVGGALIIPLGVLHAQSSAAGEPGLLAELADRRVTEQLAMRAVMEAEMSLGNTPRDVSLHNLGYDVESYDPRTQQLRFIEVKGRRAGAETVTLTRNEILCALNSPERFILALVEVEIVGAQELTPKPPRYIRRPFNKEPDPIEVSINYNMKELLALSEEAS